MSETEAAGCGYGDFLPVILCVCVPAAEFVRESAAAGNTQTVNSTNVRCRVTGSDMLKLKELKRTSA